MPHNDFVLYEELKTVPKSPKTHIIYIEYNTRQKYLIADEDLKLMSK